jgi:hypothetical protein
MTMKILVTGSTAAHVSVKKNTDTKTFSGLVLRALEESGADVVWREPSVTMSKGFLSGFDAVLVGLAHLNSTSAHRIYGALSVIQYASELGSLRLMIDAPEPKKVWAGLRAAHNDPKVLTKDFYAKRREYADVTQNPVVLDRLHAAVSTLYTSPWPRTIYPRLPWMSYPSVSTYVPNVAPDRLFGVSVDAALLSPEHVQPPIGDGDYWVADTLSSPWTAGMRALVHNRIIAARGSKWETDERVSERMRKSLGLLMSVHKFGDPWWTPMLAMSLNAGVPVVTDWRLSSYLGPAWSTLAGAVEDLSPEGRYELARQQLDAYQSAIPTWEDTVKLVRNTMFN